MVSRLAHGLLRRTFPPPKSTSTSTSKSRSRREPGTPCASKPQGPQRQPRRPRKPPAAAAGNAGNTGNASHQHHVSRLPRARTELDDMLVAVQGQQPDEIYEAFRVWTRILGDENKAAVRRAQELSGPSLSEILRSLDPLQGVQGREKHDKAHGLNLTQGMAQFADLSQWVTTFGVRYRHRRVLRGMSTLLAVRSRSPLGLTTADHEVMLRCAGAAADYQASKTMWSRMAASGLKDSRTAKTWAEFIKARFMTEPAYYQFDRSRVAVMARDLYSNREPLSMATLKRLDRIRLSINLLKREPWNRRTDEIDEDVRRLLRRRAADYRGYIGHWLRNLYYGNDVDEELICASLVAFARSSSLYAIKTLIFKNFYGIHVDQEAEPGNPEISGGSDLPPTSPLYPTPRMLYYIAEAFGSMSHIPLAMKLLDFVSRRYDLAIPAEAWSNLLNWTYVCASKPFRTMRSLHQQDLPSPRTGVSTSTTTADVRAVWEAMTSDPYNVKPTFHDLDIFIKTLLIQRSLSHALAVIRSEILPLYQRAQSEHELALHDEILQNDLDPSSPQATCRRTQAALYKDYIRHRITSWLDKLLKVASANAGYRDHAFTKTTIPDLLLEFADFFPSQIRYRTAQGVVRLRRPEISMAAGPTTMPPHFTWRKTMRQTLPQKNASIYAGRDLPDAQRPEFYPKLPVMKLLEWQRVPRLRLKALGRAPKAPLRPGAPPRVRPRRTDSPPGVASQKWWAKLAGEMML
ncbi:hypothetical protein E4U42_005560 [Claviceps africana]|uniref:Pentatricopeptide repeat domain-containing protein n=1 Tax=Claviceps africana TaxID=83212 RepID=A0A8K0JC90_9HYPO|nr:hypothetical protein E4U42_005560 [Claviceps africana]